jgi:hypothetical protein
MRVLSPLFIIGMLALSGCAKVAAVTHATAPEVPASGKGTLLPGSDIRASGFLGDYSEFTAVPDQKYLWRYVRPGVDWKQYTEVYVEPMEVWLNPEAERPGIQPQVFSKVDSLFKAIVSKEFGSHGYELVDKPGPGVLVFRGALTGVTPIHQGFEPADVLPIKAAVNVGLYAAGAEPYYIVLSGEIEMLDGGTGQRVYAAVGARRSFQTTTKGDQISWTELKDTFAWVAQRWREQLDKAKGEKG